MAGGHFLHDWRVETLIAPATGDDSTPCRIMHRWNVVQYELIPELEDRWRALTPKLERLIHILEWVSLLQNSKNSNTRQKQSSPGPRGPGVRPRGAAASAAGRFNPRPAREGRAAGAFRWSICLHGSCFNPRPAREGRAAAR